MAQIDYKTVVQWDTTLVDVGYADSSISSGLKGLAINAIKITTGAPATNAGYFIAGAMIQNSVDGTIYRNTGTSAAPVWALIDSGPYVVQFSGTATGGTTATRAYTITGVLATDIASAVISASQNAVTIQKATLSANTLTVLFSGDPGTGTSVDYQIVRPTS